MLGKSLGVDRMSVNQMGRYGQFRTILGRRLTGNCSINGRRIGWRGWLSSSNSVMLSSVSLVDRDAQSLRLTGVQLRTSG